MNEHKPTVEEVQWFNNQKYLNTAGKDFLIQLLEAEDSRR